MMHQYFILNYNFILYQISAPRCPGFCLLNIMTAFCERPAILMPVTSNCKKGSVCCDNTRTVPTPKPRPAPTRPRTTTPAPTEATEKPDPRTECPGTCIVGLLSFTCFRNAEMTDLFKCKKSGTQCCAPKTKIQEKQDTMGVNISMTVDPAMPQAPSQYMNGGGGGGSGGGGMMGVVNNGNHGSISGDNNALRTPSYTPATVGLY